MAIATLLLYTTALICFLLDTIGTKSPLALTPLGLACWIAVPLLHGIN